MRAAITAAMDSKKAKLNTPFTKYLAIANPNNGTNFLMEVHSMDTLIIHEYQSFIPVVYMRTSALLSPTLQIAKHWSMNLTPEMTIEKLQLLATSALPSDEKERILVL